MKQRIVEALRNIERVEGVEILLAVESGSRVWGFESTNSDYDIRFIYVREPKYYLSVFDKRDVLEYPLTEDDLDFSGWDLKKACQLLYKSNPSLNEWLISPEVYIDSERIAPLRAAAKYYFNARTAFYHYLAMAKGNYRMYLQGDEVQTKKYFYVLRPLLACDWISRRSSMPPVVFEELLDDYEGLFPMANVQELLKRKKAGEELDKGPRLELVNAWIDTAIPIYESMANLARTPSLSTDLLNQYFCHVALNSRFSGGKYP